VEARPKGGTSTMLITIAIAGSENKNKRVHFDPMSKVEYLAFLIKRIN
jgi:hypothetical protein